MQDVSCEPLMLCPSENPQASLDIFSHPHHHPAGFCINRKAINKDKPTVPWKFLFYHGLDGLDGFACGGNRSKSFCGLRRHPALGLSS